MILGIGTDLCDIGRIERALERFGERFAARILVEAELRRFRLHRKGAAYLAKRFAAKEAFSKALGTGILAPAPTPADPSAPGPAESSSPSAASSSTGSTGCCSEL